MNYRPLIGISGSFNAPEKQLFIRENYIQAVLNAGGIPVLLPYTEDEQVAEAILDRLDGLLMAGGVDVRPERFGEKTLPECGEIDLKRDAFELLILPMALERGMPVFGICRGIQVIAVAMGGTLYQDIESQLGIKRIDHYQNPPYGEATHPVRFEQGGLFERLAGKGEVMANSMHHQSVKDPGPNLIVEGVSPDGIIEAIRAKDSDAVFAVQYHPEYLADHDDAGARLFAHLVDCARAYAETK